MCTINSKMHSLMNVMWRCDRWFVTTYKNSISDYVINCFYDHTHGLSPFDTFWWWWWVFKLKCGFWIEGRERERERDGGWLWWIIKQQRTLVLHYFFFALHNNDWRIYFAYVSLLLFFVYLIYLHSFSIDICLVAAHNSRSAHRARRNARWSIVYLLQWQQCVCTKCRGWVLHLFLALLILIILESIRMRHLYGTCNAHVGREMLTIGLLYCIGWSERQGARLGYDTEDTSAQSWISSNIGTRTRYRMVGR